jgi:hypothetical protein
VSLSSRKHHPGNDFTFLYAFLHRQPFRREWLPSDQLLACAVEQSYPRRGGPRQVWMATLPGCLPAWRRLARLLKVLDETGRCFRIRSHDSRLLKIDPSLLIVRILGACNSSGNFPRGFVFFRIDSPATAPSREAFTGFKKPPPPTREFGWL